MGLVNVNEDWKHFLFGAAAGSAGTYLIPRGVQRFGQYIGRNIAQQIKAASNPGETGADPYNRLNSLIENLTGRLSQLESEVYKRGG